jgi:uncharacterized protein with GYD domain
MATYFLSGEYGMDAMKGISRKRTAEVTRIVEDFGGKILSTYLLLGETDLVIIAEFPGLNQALQASVTIGKRTGISFKTYPAITAAEFDELLG